MATIRRWDAAEAEALYGLIESQIVPEFYARDGEGIPRRWVSRMRESMARLAPQFSANRTVREYTEKHYVPAAACVPGTVARTAASWGQSFCEWGREIAAHWDRIRFGAITVEKRDHQYFL